MTPDGEQQGLAGTMVQALFSSYLDDVVSLDIVTLEPLTWGNAHVPGGTPITLSLKVPVMVAESMLVITEQWAADCEILGIGVHRSNASETVVLDGPTDQLLLEVIRSE